jgi:hypothetical protein
LAGLIAVLCLQFAVAYYWSEPYPAVIEPGFLGSPPTTGRAIIKGYRVVATGPSSPELVLSAADFFNEVPHSYLLDDVPFVLNPTPPEPSGWRRLRLRLQRRAKLRSDAGVAAFGIYAQRRLADLTGRTDWETLRIEETLRDLDLDRMSYVGPSRVNRSREFHLR